MDGDGSDNYISMSSHCIFEFPKKKSNFVLETKGCIGKWKNLPVKLFKTEPTCIMVVDFMDSILKNPPCPLCILRINLHLMLKWLDLEAFLLWKTHPSRTFFFFSSVVYTSQAQLLRFCFFCIFFSDSVFFFSSCFFVFFSRILASLILLGCPMAICWLFGLLSFDCLSAHVSHCPAMFGHRCADTIHRCSAHHVSLFGHHPQLYYDHADISLHFTRCSTATIGHHFNRSSATTSTVVQPPLGR